MPIIAAAVEANGWVLRLDVTASPGSFASYALDPIGSPRITLTSAHAGFVKSAGQAVAGNLARTIVATKPLRRPVNWNGTGLDPVIVDETNVGGGVIRVRIALSETIYVTETGLTLSLAAGWRTGEVAASAVSVINNSTIVAPIPIMRWALPPQGVTTGPFRVSLFVASHHPVGLEPVAGVKFVITDNTTDKVQWVTALGTDNSLGDNLRCYTAVIDPATATALTAGLLRVDAEVYPWLGAMRTTDPAGTQAMTAILSRNVDAASPWMIGYDPAGTRYSNRFAFIDVINGTTTATAGMIQPTLAAAKAIAPGSRPRTIATALQAAYLANYTLPAANGNASLPRSGDGLQVVLGAGFHQFGLGGGSVTSGFDTIEVPARIYGDPDNANPRANCILKTVVHGALRTNRWHFSNMTIEMTGPALLVGGTSIFFDNVEFRGEAGQESQTGGLLTAAPGSTLWNVAMTRCRWWRYGEGIMNGQPRVGLFRNNEFSRNVNTFLFAAKNRLIGNLDANAPTGATTPFGAYPGSVAGQVEDIIIAFNDMRRLRGRVWTPSSLPAATAGTPNASTRRFAFIGNVLERIGADPQPFWSFGEGASATMSYNIIESNSFIAERANTFYSDPPTPNLAALDTLRNQAFCNRIANNFFDWLPTKHDDFFNPGAAALRGNGNGFRPHMVEAWSMLYGVDQEANVNSLRSGNSSFSLEFSGLRSINGYGGVIDPLFTDDLSPEGPGGAGALGGGNYTPLAGSPLLARGMRGNTDVDASARTLSLPFASGAFQATIAVLSPQNAGSGHRAAAAALVPALAPALQPAAARSPVSTPVATLGWSALLGANPARHGLTGAGNIAWSATVAPAAGTIALTGSANIGWATSLTAAPARQSMTNQAVPLALMLALPPSSAILPLAFGATDLIQVSQPALAPGAAYHPLFTLAGQLTLPAARPVARHVIGADPRTIIPFRN